MKCDFLRKDNFPCQKTAGRTCVYLGYVENDIDLSLIYPAERACEIASVSNCKLQLQKYSAWRLLERAFKECFEQNIKELEFYKSANGKWQCADENYRFSISHTDGVVAVAVSDVGCGVDVEKHIPGRMGEKHAKKILTPQQREEYYRLDESLREMFLLKQWTIKESVFKMNGGDVFIPAQIDDAENSISFEFSACGYGYCLSVSAQGGSVELFGKAQNFTAI